MNKRSFLLGGVATIATTGSVFADRQMAQGMGGMPAMGGTSGSRDMGGMAKPSGRIAALPEGAPLRDLPKLANASSTPGQFVGTLVAAPTKIELAPGKVTEILAYNGHLVGPMIEIDEGDQIKISFENRIAGQESTIHWHGLPIPPQQDGNPMDPVASGSTHLYGFTIPAESAGPYWYHPHPHRNTAEQTYRGLAGPFIVRPRTNPLPAELVETTLFISSISLLENGAIAPNTMVDWMNGREGDHVLVNGQRNPVLQAAPGSSRRFRIYNATNGRYLRLSFGGHTMTLIGSDGGFLASPVPGVTDILLAPAERADVVVDFRRAGGRVTLQDLPYDRGWMGPGKPASTNRSLLSIDLSGQPQQPVTLPTRLRTIPPLGASMATKRLLLGERMSTGPNGMTMEFLINGRAFDMARIDFTSRRGDVETWEIVNPTDMDHPIHLHGMHFQIVEREKNGQKAAEPILAWKDTVNVARNETVRIKVRQDIPGRRMFHCHVLEHEELGMMGVVDVI